MDKIRFHQELLLERAHLSGLLEEPLSNTVRASYFRAPRHRFIRRYRGFDTQWHEVTDTSLEAHLPRLYADAALTVFEDHAGGRVSSISQPSLVLGRLNMLRLEPGQRVLELGMVLRNPSGGARRANFLWPV